MENQTNPNCDCSDGCCTPQKKNSPWKKWVLIAIILAAGAIVTVKLASKDNTKPAECCDTPENSSCCP